MSASRPSLDEIKAVASIGELLARERRARLAAERRLVSMQAELMRANASLDAHARRLASEIGPLRREAHGLRGAAGRLAEEARAADRRLWDALEATPDGFAIYDAGLRLVAANARYLAPFEGLDEMAPGIAYARVLELVADEGIVDIGMLRPGAWVASMVARIDQERPEPAVLRMWDGVCVRLLHRRAASGDLVVLAVDVTETMEREAELEEARHRAEAASRAKSAFLANMSHELRTPLGGILGMSSLLVEEDLTEDQRQQVEVIQASGEALLSIVDDVLDLGRIEGARLALRPAPFDPRAVIEEVVRMHRPSAVARGLTLSADLDEALPLRLVGDGGRLRQMLANLVGNAVKFTPTGQVTIRAVGAGTPSPGMARLHVSVEDTGIGIAEDDLEQMFGAFEQAEGGHDRHHDGAGLGLTVTRRLLEMMGGEIWADSAPGRGSCFGFRVDLPIGRDPAPGEAPRGEARGEGGGGVQAVVPRLGLHRPGGGDAAAPRASDGPPAPEAPEREGPGGEDRPDPPVVAPPMFARRPDAPAKDAGEPEPEPDRAAAAPRRMRVLAAEDNRANQMILRRMLAGLDIALTLVADGAEAVAAFERERPDLILMDISMPGVDGREATRRIRVAEAASGAPPVPVVAMTAHALAGDEGEIRAAGLDGYLPKPLRKAAIRDVVLLHAPSGVASPDAEAAE